ncbi:hypothetical protein KQH61_06125 [bacterium]|nr:hypothetical protein [bacterium]
MRKARRAGITISIGFDALLTILAFAVASLQVGRPQWWVLWLVPLLMVLVTVLYALSRLASARKRGVEAYERERAFLERQGGDDPVTWLRPVGYDGNLKQYEPVQVPAPESSREALIQREYRREWGRWFGNDKGVNQP